jgi:hypothetical protein
MCRLYQLHPNMAWPQNDTLNNVTFEKNINGFTTKKNFVTQTQCSKTFFKSGKLQTKLSLN